MSCFKIVKDSGFTITSYNYDGFQVLKREGVEELVVKLNNQKYSLSHNKDKHIAFENIKFIIKPFKNALETSQLISLESQKFEEKIFNLTGNYKHKKEYFEKFFAKIKSPTLFVEVKDNDFVLYKRSDFGVAYQHLQFINEKGQNQPFILAWLCDKDIRTFENMDYYPTGDMCPQKTFNLWNDFPIKRIAYDRNADTSILYEHISTLLKEDEKDIDWFLNWLAHIIQFPHKKTEVCVILYDKEFGTGKSLLAEEFLKKIIGLNKMMVSCKTEKVFGKFTNTQGKLLCVLNEAKGKDTFELNDIIKEAITGKTIQMEKKGVDAIQVSDYLNYIITTNNLNSVKLEEGDRRFMVFATSNKLKGNFDYFNKLLNALNDDVIMRKFYEELMNRKLSNYIPSRDRQNNKIMEIMKEHNKDIIIEFINYWKQEADDSDPNSLIKSKMKGLDLYKRFCEFYEMCGNPVNNRPSLTKFGVRVKVYDNMVSSKKSNGCQVYQLIFN